MDSKTENDIPVPAATEAEQQPEDDPEYTPQPSGKRRKTADAVDTLLESANYVDTPAPISEVGRERPPRWTVPMNEKLKQFYLELQQTYGSKRQVWDLVAVEMMRAFPYYKFDGKYCHNHYHYCTKLNDHLGDEVDDADVSALLETVNEYGDHDGAWFRIALALREKTGKLRGAKDLKNWYLQIKQEQYGHVEPAQLLTSMSHDQASNDILSQLTDVIATVQNQAVHDDTAAVVAAAAAVVAASESAQAEAATETKEAASAQ